MIAPAAAIAAVLAGRGRHGTAHRWSEIARAEADLDPALAACMQLS